MAGLSLEPEGTPNLFTDLELEGRMDHAIGDIRDPDVVRNRILEVQPDFVFHLAAQPLVRASYREPVETFATNVMGTAHVLEALRAYANASPEHTCVAVMITTDKCYHNREWLHAYREEDPMGGHDPYSASKGACELVIQSFRDSFFSSSAVPKVQIALASARAGNVIGGGDWAEDRIVPDCIRALQQQEPIAVRNRIATRPWQHVLEPLCGYVTLASEMDQRLKHGGEVFPMPSLEDLCGPYNFGPTLTSNQSVEHLVEEILKHWPGVWEDRSDPDAVHEASKLNLSIEKAFHLLNWSPAWEFEQTIRRTVEWYQQYTSGSPARTLVQQDIRAYETSLDNEV